MSTRSNIARLDPETGRVTSIYCHWDGYPDGVGATLATHYNTDDAVRALLALGGLSALRERLAPAAGEAHSFDAPLDDVTIAYARDRGEPWDENKPSEHRSVRAWVTDLLANSWYDYLYLYRDGSWTHLELETAGEAVDALCIAAGMTEPRE